MKYSKAEKAEAIAEICKLMHAPINGEKQAVYQLVRHVSTSGMPRNISTWVIQDGALVRLDYYISRICDLTIAKHGGIKISGCGMDMGFHLLDSLCWRVWEDRSITANSFRQVWL